MYGLNNIANTIENKLARKMPGLTYFRVRSIGTFYYRTIFLQGFPPNIEDLRRKIIENIPPPKQVQNGTLSSLLFYRPFLDSNKDSIIFNNQDSFFNKVLHKKADPREIIYLEVLYY
jgi:hypothetical protein